MPDTELNVLTKEFPQTQKTSSVIVNETYSWINNAGFYSLVNPTYYTYYYNNVRRIAQWLDGYVPTFHKETNGIFSTRFANSLINSVGEAIFGRELLFRNVGKEKDKKLDNNSLKFYAKWSKNSNFQAECKRAIKFAKALGTSLLKINIENHEELWIEAVRLDYFYFEVDARNDVKEVVCLLKGYTDVSKNGDTANFYLVEKRFYKYQRETKFRKNHLGVMESYDTIVQVPHIVYQVHKYAGNILNNNTYSTDVKQTIAWDSIPKKVRDAIKKDYSIIQIGVEQELPFKNSLGAHLMTADDGNISLPNTPFGLSMLENIVSYLMGYDIAYSYFFRDMYQGKGIVLMPKFMAQNKYSASNISDRNPFLGLDESMFMTYETTSQEKQMIEQVQFNLRSQEWAQIRDYLIENIAMTLQLSPRTIASFLSAGGLKTATQVSSEDSNSVSFIEISRSVAEKTINKLLKCVSDFYGLEDEVEIKFSKEGVINTNELLQRITMEKQAGLISEYDALKEWMYDSDEEQVKEAYEKIQQDKQRQMQEAMMMQAGPMEGTPEGEL